MLCLKGSYRVHRSSRDWDLGLDPEFWGLEEPSKRSCFGNFRFCCSTPSFVYVLVRLSIRPSLPF